MVTNKELQERTDAILCGLPGGRAEPYRADPDRYHAVEGFRSHWSPEELAWDYDHIEGDAPSEYVKAFGEAEEAFTVSAGEAARAIGFPLIVCDALEGLAHPIPEAVRKWAGSYRGVRTPWLWITGGTGAGKTCTAAVAAVEARRHASRSGAFTFETARHITEIVDGSGNYRDRTGHETKHEAMAKWIEAELLIVDDLGLERKTATSWATLSRLFDERQAEKRPTIITCPYSGSQWLHSYEGSTDRHEIMRLAGRIGDALCGWTGDTAAMKAHRIDLTGDDMRLRLEA